MNIYLDIKKTPINIDKFIIIRNFVDFVSHVSQEKVSLLSVSHNLSDTPLALDAAMYLIRKDIFIPYINFHEYSKTGSLLIKKRLEKKFPDTITTMNSQI